MHGDGNRSSLVGVGLVVGLAMALFLAPAGSIASPEPAETLPSSTPSSFVFVNATQDFEFQPDAVTVSPGTFVHFVITQASDVEHTFDLSPLANYTIPSGYSSEQLAAFFSAHPPLVNLTLSASPTGAEYFANISAPPVGTYEFVCTIHFAYGMVGMLTVGTSSSSSTSPWLAIEIGVGAGAAVIVIGLVVFWVRRRHIAGPPPGVGPSGPETGPGSPPANP